MPQQQVILLRAPGIIGPGHNKIVVVITVIRKRSAIYTKFNRNKTSSKQFTLKIEESRGVNFEDRG